jgi:hypothetical protein
MALLAGTLLIHCVAEDAFWLLGGLVGGLLRGHYEDGAMGLKVDKGVFEGLVKGSEKEIWGLLKEVGIDCRCWKIAASDVVGLEFLEQWWRNVFIRCLPWPTALRVVDVVISEGTSCFTPRLTYP